MAAYRTDDEWLSEWKASGGSATEMAKATGISERNIRARKMRMERSGRLSPVIQGPQGVTKWAYHRLRNVEVENGVVIVYSDAHYWPSEPPTLAFQSLLKLCSALSPKVIIANGDLIDGARISRFPASGWAKSPSMKSELDETQARQADVKRAAPKAKLFRTVGNHDIRLDRFFATNADQFEGLPGTRLSDFLPDWPESYSVRINGNTWVKHRYRGGIYAARNNVMYAGCSMVTGHTHLMDAKPLRGYRPNTVWGVQTGTLAQTTYDLPEEGAGPFEYSEDNPSDAASGFVVLTYHKGALLPPEFCWVENGKAWFRGQVVK